MNGNGLGDSRPANASQRPHDTPERVVTPRYRPITAPIRPVIARKYRPAPTDAVSR